MIFFIEPLDIIEIEMKGQTHFSKWEKLDGLYLDITTISLQGEETKYTTIDKNDYLALLNHKGQNDLSKYIMQFSNQSPNSLSFALFLSPYYSWSKDKQLKLNGQYELCDIDETYLRQHSEDLFLYNYPTTFGIPLFITFPLCGLSLFLFYIVGCCSMVKEMKKYAYVE